MRKAVRIVGVVVLVLWALFVALQSYVAARRAQEACEWAREAVWKLGVPDSTPNDPARRLGCGQDAP